jgi:hypothetical protein
MTYFNCAGSNTINGNLSSLPSVMTSFTCQGSNTVNAYTAPKTFAASFSQLYIVTPSGGLTSAMVDSIFIDLDNSLNTTTGRTLYLTGAGIGAPTSASAAARTDLINNKRATITTN